MFKSLTGDFHVRSELFFIPYKARSPSFDFRCEVKRCQGVRTLGFWHLFGVGCRYFSAKRINDGGSDYKKCQVHRFRQPTPLPLHRNLKVGDWDLEEKKVRYEHKNTA